MITMSCSQWLETWKITRRKRKNVKAGFI